MEGSELILVIFVVGIVLAVIFAVILKFVFNFFRKRVDPAFRQKCNKCSALFSLPHDDIPQARNHSDRAVGGTVVSLIGFAKGDMGEFAMGNAMNTDARLRKLEENQAIDQYNLAATTICELRKEIDGGLLKEQHIVPEGIPFRMQVDLFNVIDKGDYLVGMFRAEFKQEIFFYEVVFTNKCSFWSTREKFFL